MTDKKPPVFSGPPEEKRPNQGESITGQQAVALTHDATGGGLPRVAAKAEGELAQELLRLAVEHHIPIKYDPDLVQVLAKMEIGQAIPEEVYLVVAELLAFIYWVNQEFYGG